MGGDRRDLKGPAWGVMSGIELDGTGHPAQRVGVDRPKLAGSMRTAMLWNLLGFIVAQASGLVVFLVLASQLPPAIFGIVALAALVADYIAFDGRVACADAIVQSKDFEPRALNSAFATFMTMTVIFAIAVVVTAPFLGRLFDEPLVADILPVFALLLLPVPWLAVMDAIFMRDLRFRSVTERNIVGNLVSGVAGIACAFTPWAIYALVVQRLVALVVAAVLEYRVTRWRPGLDTDAALRQAFARRFLPLWAIMVLTQTVGRAFLFVFGLRFDTTTVGLTRVAGRVVEALQGPLTSPLMGLWFPLMAKVRGDHAAEREVYNSIILTSAFLCFPAFAGLALMSRDVVTLLLPAQYADAVPLVAAIAASRILIPVIAFNTLALSSLGMNRLSLYYSMATVAAEFLSLLVFSSFGPVAALVLGPLSALPIAYVGARIQGRRIDQTVGQLYLALVPGATATLVMLGATTFAQWLLLPSPIWVRVPVCVVVGAVTYGAYLWHFHRQWLMDRLRLLRGRGAI